jgi:hypothetical protein
MAADRAGSAWYFGTSFLFAPVLAAMSPWPAATTVLWWAIGLTGLYLGLLGIAMTIGLARVLRSGAEIPEDYWRSMIDHRPAGPRDRDCHLSLKTPAGSAAGVRSRSRASSHRTTG